MQFTMNRRSFLASAAAGLLPAQQKSPNLLYVIADQFRFDAMSCAGNALLPTPNLDRLARDGVRFDDGLRVTFELSRPDPAAPADGK